eukprot:1728869-Rhodomonas_salina.1
MVVASDVLESGWFGLGSASVSVAFGLTGEEEDEAGFVSQIVLLLLEFGVVGALAISISTVCDCFLDLPCWIEHERWIDEGSSV